MTCLISKIDYFQVLSMVQSIFIRLGDGKKVTTILRLWLSGGLGTPEVKIASVPVPTFTGDKMASIEDLKLEVAATTDFIKQLIQATYDLEGNGPLVFS